MASYIREGRNYILLLLGLLGATFWLLTYAGSPMGGDDTPILIVVPKGATAADVGKKLKAAGLIRSVYGFTFVARATSEANNIKPGAYRFTKDMSLRHMLNTMVNGDVSAVWVTIPEGFTIHQIAARLADKGVLNTQQFLSLVNTGAAEFRDVLNIPSEGLEGYLFPDTYLFPLDAEPRETIEQMLKNLRSRVVEPFSSEIAKAAGSNSPAARAEELHRVLTVASMIEREARVPSDRPLISAVIWNRLQRGMKLDIDATVLYALGEHRRRLYYRDLAVESPYNTYLHAGLPPGPISCPGVESIKAALHPAKVDYLYYVARPDGSHAFSRTLDEHNNARNRIRNGG
jgi:UPF0755 protein